MSYRLTRHGPLREAREDDITELMELEYALFDNNMSETTLQRELAAGKGYVFDVLGEIVGYALVRDDGSQLDLTRLGVAIESQGGGIGQVLLTHALSLGKPVVLTVLKSNRGALRLYLRNGFKIVGHLPSDAAWAMRHEASGSTQAARRAVDP
jgi:ribosomal protein S18 acetylase RimI-like enzyme